MSEEELLLLSNYVYMNASTDPITIRESIGRYKNAEGGFDENSVAAAGIGGGMDRKQAAELFTRMDEMPDSFLDLYPSRVKEEKDLRGVCFTDGKTDNGTGTVVFRGTGGTYDAWYDNVIGEYLPSTAIQKEAADFITYDCMGFSDLTVTGHSKGGNLAMYTTVACATSVAACVSFDGQGFSKAFQKEYKTEIKNAKGKIKSISAHNDFVNILLHPIAGERVFAKNEADGIDAHSSFFLLTSNEFDENGDLTSLCAQSFGAWALGEVLMEVTDRMDILPEGGNEEISDLLAAYVASVMSEDKGEAYEQEKIREAGESVAQYLFELLPGMKLADADGTRIDLAQRDLQTHVISQTSTDLIRASDRMKHLHNRLLMLSDSIDPTERIGYYVNLQLQSLSEQMEERLRAFSACQETLERIRELYVSKEQTLVSAISAG